jgi:cytochrome P450 family 110
VHPRLPPGPKQHALRQLRSWLTRPLPFFEACAKEYGDIFTLDLGPLLGKWVLVWSPELVRHLYTADSSFFEAGKAKASIFGPIVGATSTSVLDGDAHAARRRLVNPAFRGEKLSATTEPIRNLTEAALRQWPRETWFSADPPLQQVALSAVLGGIFGEAMAAELPTVFGHLTKEAVASRLLFLKFLQIDLGRWSPWGRVLKAVRAADRATYGEIARRRSKPQGDDADVLGMLLAARTDDGTPLSEPELRDELMSLVVAGNETVGLSLAWLLVSLASNPAALTRAREEVDRVVGDAPLDRSHVPRLEWVDACVKESLRLNSAAANGSARKIVRPFEIGGYVLPPGTMVNVGIHLLHRRPELYPNPERFEPERFLGTKINPYHWVPFGGGARRCLGMAFALQEMKIVLATLLRRLEFELRPGPIAALRRGAFVYPEGGPMIRVRDRDRPRESRSSEPRSAAPPTT